MVNELPESLRPEYANIAAVVPVQERPELNSIAYTLLADSIAALKRAKYVDNIYLVASDASLAERLDVLWIGRDAIQNVDILGIDELLQKVLKLSNHVEISRSRCCM